MTKLHELREIIKGIYGRFTPYVELVLKGLAALTIYFMINSNLNFYSGFSNPFIIIILALFSAILPWKFVTLASIAMVVINLNAISIWYAALSGMLLLMMFLTYFHISLEKGIFLVLMPIAFFLKIPYVIPVAAGLVSSPVDAFAMAFGIVFYNMIIFAKSNLLPFSIGGEKELSKVVESLSEAGKYIFKNPLMITYILVFAATVMLVYIIKRLPIRYSWIVAIAVGNIIMLIAMLVGDYRFDLGVSVTELLIGIIVSIVVNLIITFFAFNVDYSATEHLQFEDDEYYYYVKAVPKVSISMARRTVRRITAKKPGGMYRTDDIDPEKGVSGR